MNVARALATFALLAGTGCLQANTEGGGIGVNQTACPTCKRSTNAGGLAGGGSSGGTSSTGGGASTGGASTQATAGGSGGTSSGGSTGGANSCALPDAGPVACPAILACGVPIDCPSGSLDFSCQLVDYLQCTPVAGATIEALNPEGIPYTAASALSAANGTFSLCLPEDSPFTLEATAASYPTTYFPELQGVQQQELEQLGMVSSAFLTSIGPVVPGGLNPNMGLVVVNVNTGRVCDMSRPGWSLEMSIPDGGSFPDGSYELAYLDGSGLPTTGLDATTGSGGAIFYNLDTSVTNFVDLAYQQDFDGGSTCQPQNGEYGFTGRVYVANGALSGFPILLP